MDSIFGIAFGFELNEAICMGEESRVMVPSLDFMYQWRY